MPSSYPSTSGEYIFQPFKKPFGILFLLIFVQFQSVTSKPTTIRPRLNMDNITPDDISETLQLKSRITEQNGFRFNQSFVETSLNNGENILEPIEEYEGLHVMKEQRANRRRRRIRSITDPFSEVFNRDQNPNTGNKDGNILSNVKSELSSLFTSTKQTENTNLNTGKDASTIPSDNKALDIPEASPPTAKGSSFTSAKSHGDEGENKLTNGSNNSSIKSKPTPSSNSDNKSEKTADGDTREPTSSDSLKPSTIPGEITPKMSSPTLQTASGTSHESSRSSSDTKALDTSEASPPTVKGSPRSSAKSHDDGGENTLINGSNNSSIESKPMPNSNSDDKTDETGDSETRGQSSSSLHSTIPGEIPPKMSSSTSKSTPGNLHEAPMSSSDTKALDISEASPSTAKGYPYSSAKSHDDGGDNKSIIGLNNRSMKSKPTTSSNSDKSSDDGGENTLINGSNNSTIESKPTPSSDNKSNETKDSGTRSQSSSNPVKNSTIPGVITPKMSSSTPKSASGTLHEASTVSSNTKALDISQASPPKVKGPPHSLAKTNDGGGNKSFSSSNESSIDSKPTPSSKSDNKSQETKDSGTRGRSSSHPLKNSTIPGENPTKMSSSTPKTASGSSHEASTFSSDTKALYISEASPPTVEGPLHSSAKSNDEGGGNTSFSGSNNGSIESKPTPSSNSDNKSEKTKDSGTRGQSSFNPVKPSTIPGQIPPTPKTTSGTSHEASKFSSNTKALDISEASSTTVINPPQSLAKSHDDGGENKLNNGSNNSNNGSKPKASSDSDNKSGEAKDSETIGQSSSYPVKHSNIPDTITSNMHPTSKNAPGTSHETSTFSSDTKASDMSEASSPTVIGPPYSSAKPHDDEGEDPSINESGLPMKSKPNSPIDNTSRKMTHPPSVSEEVSNKSSSSFDNLYNFENNMKQPNNNKNQSIPGKERTDSANSGRQNNSKEPSEATPTKLEGLPKGEIATSAEIIGEAPTNILSLNQTKNAPKSDNQVIDSLKPSKEIDSTGKRGKHPSKKDKDTLGIPYTNEVSEEKVDIPYKNEINSEDNTDDDDDDDIVVLTEATVDDPNTGETTKVKYTPEKTSKIPSDGTSEHSTEKLRKLTDGKIDENQTPKTDPTKNNPKQFTTETTATTSKAIVKSPTPQLKTNHFSTVQPVKPTEHSEYNSSETTPDPEENKQCENGTSLSGILGSALHYGALGGSAGAVGAMLPQILKMLKDLFKKDGDDDKKNNEDNENNAGNTDDTNQDNATQDDPNQQQNTESQPDSMEDLLEKEISEAEDEVMNKVEDIEDNVMDTIKGKLKEVEDGVIGDLKQQILHGDGSILKNAKEAFIGGENNIFQKAKSRLMDAKEDLIADMKKSFKSEKEDNELSEHNRKEAVGLKKEGGNLMKDIPRTNIQFLFINDEVSNRRTSWPTTRNDYLGKACAPSVGEKEITKIEDNNPSEGMDISNKIEIGDDESHINIINHDVPEESTKNSKIMDYFKSMMNK